MRRLKIGYRILGAIALLLLPVVASAQSTIAGIVRDTTGQRSQSGDVEVCVRTTAPPFFRGCSVAGARGGDGWALASLALAALLLRRRTRIR